ncbi:MarR family winged helix-turn-helix transcriptional regulator [Blautia sp. HCP28S3_G10]|uniref:MarR family winged helix-turn-helix transcriptional regulator n=1 Tax=Blautia sp. HCP28S3_G10 TaxID=3438908 RepID=UPI003F8CB907
MHMNIEFARKMSLAYNKTCKSLCQQLNIPQTAFDILMFLANNPDYKSARDIVEVRKLKANLVSVNVDKLVRDGYLERNSVEGDRRKTELLCTKKALPVIEQGKKLQHDFMEKTLTGISYDQRALLTEILDSIEKNLNIILQSE